MLDDASTDESRNIIEKYRMHPQVKAVLYNDRNSGSPMVQWQKGISAATSDWIYIAESDDTCDLRLFECLVPAFQQPNIVLTLTEVQYINGKDEIVLRFPPLGEGQWKGSDFVNRYMLYNCYLCNSGMAIFRKCAAPMLGQWQQQLPYSPDYYFWIRLMFQGNIYNNGQIMANFRKHPKEFTHGKWGSIAEHLDHANMLRLLFKENLLSLDAISSIIQYKLIGLATQQKGMDKNEYEDYVGVWNSLAQDCEVRISHSKVYLLAFIRKLKHKFGFKYK